MGLAFVLLGDAIMLVAIPLAMADRTRTAMEFYCAGLAVFVLGLVAGLVESVK